MDGLGQRGERVGEPGAVRGGRRRDPPAGTEVRVGRDDAAGFVTHGRKRRRGLLLERIEEVGIAIAHDPEDVRDVAGECKSDVR